MIVTTVIVVFLIEQCHMGCVSVTNNGTSAIPRASTLPIQSVSNEDSHLLHDELLKAEVRSCGFQSVIIISTLDMPFINGFIKILTGLFSSIIHYDLDIENVSLSEVIEDGYIDFAVRYFVIMVRNPFDLMLEAENVFNKQRRGRTAMMPHSTRWLIISESSSIDIIADNFRNSLFDNLCIINFLRDAYTNHSLRVENVQTLMWRASRLREFEQMDMLNLGNDCSIFPNTWHGLNGRNFDTLTKFFFSKSFIQWSDESTETESLYSGVYYDVIKAISDSLNFTLSVYVTNVSWADYRKEICHRHYDIGLSFWRPDNDDPCPMANTYPVNFFIVSGMYQKPKSELFSYGFSLSPIFPLPSGTFYFLLPALLVLPLLYLFLKNCSHQFFEKRNSSSQENDLANSRCAIHTFTQRYVKVLGQHCGPCVNHSTLPNPSYFSGRIHVWSWSITMVLFCAMYGGFLTSHKIRPNERLPFQTYNGMLQLGDYRWGTFNRITLQRILKRSNDAVLRELGEGMVMIDVDHEEIDEVVKVKKIISILDEKFVIMINEATASYLIPKVRDIRPMNLNIMKNILFYYQSGYVLPSNSELTEFLSKHIMFLHEGGLREKIFKDYSLSSNLKAGLNSIKNSKQNNSRDMVISLGILCSILTVFCFLVLVLEIVSVNLIVPLYLMYHGVKYIGNSV